MAAASPQALAVQQGGASVLALSQQCLDTVHKARVKYAGNE